MKNFFDTNKFEKQFYEHSCVHSKDKKNKTIEKREKKSYNKGKEKGLARNKSHVAD